MQNQEIKKIAKDKRVPQWRIAQKIGVSEMTLTRWLRVDLTPEKRTLIINAIDEISKSEAKKILKGKEI